jgi:hypothetical protein
MQQQSPAGLTPAVTLLVCDTRHLADCQAGLKAPSWSAHSSLAPVQQPVSSQGRVVNTDSPNLQISQHTAARHLHRARAAASNASPAAVVAVQGMR